MSLNLDFKVQKEQKVREIEDSLQNYLPKQKGYQKIIMEAMGYSLLAGGNRLRPMLMKETYTLFGGHSKVIEPFMAAIEMVHTYSLVHDDLPALDNDDYRRGKLTTHKKFGEAQGILIGDSLLTHAFNVLTEKNEGVISYEKIVEIVKLTSSYAGINGMIGGQMMDIASEGKRIDMETLKYIHSNKTGKLIKLPVEIGCIIGEATPEEKEPLIKFSELIGLAFQIKDDILDIEGDFLTLGKPVGSDQELEKSTYPALIGLNESKELLKNTIEEAKSILVERFGEEKSAILLKLADYIGNRNK